ncbi:uncharacterized protein LOC136026913 [Artemia franciscana]
MLLALVLAYTLFQASSNAVLDIDLKPTPSENPCHFGSQSSQPVFIYNNESAVLQIGFKPLPKFCNLTSYHIAIQSNLSELTEKPANCYDHNLAQHSDQHIQNSDVPMIWTTFPYVYSGIYCIGIIPKQSTNSRKPFYKVCFCF